MNESAKSLMGHKDYIHRVGFAVPLLDPNEAGLPHGDEMALLGEVEDMLADALEADQNSLMVLVISTCRRSLSSEAVLAIGAYFGSDYLPTKNLQCSH